MSRFAPIPQQKLESTLVDNSYQFGFHTPTDCYAYKSGKGLTEKVVEEISGQKNEPEWMREKRLEGFKVFRSKKMPDWGANLSTIDFENIHYYLRPTDKEGKNWNDVPAEIKSTFEKLGIPQAEQKALAGVKAQFDSEVIYGSIKKMLAHKGVIFLGMDEALRQYPDIVKQHFGTIIPVGDNKFAALNTAAWSGGSFVYVPKNVEVGLPLQAYFRINAPNAGQFERTLIIADEGSKVHYIEGCFSAGTTILTQSGQIAIEDVKKGRKVLTHLGRYRTVIRTQIRKYDGALYQIGVRGNPSQPINATEEHPFLIVRREKRNERNSGWHTEWVSAKDIHVKDYACIPIDRRVQDQPMVRIPVLIGRGRHGFTQEGVDIPTTPEFFRLLGYYVAEGSISGGHYLNFSFNEQERQYIDDVKALIKKIFDEERVNESAHAKNHGVNIVVRSTKLCRVFQDIAGSGAAKKSLAQWVMQESVEKQKQLLLGWFRGDGNYYKKQNSNGFKEIFRISTVSSDLAFQGRQLLARCNIASGVNKRNRDHEGRKSMYAIVIGGQYLIPFGELVGVKIQDKLYRKKRATHYYLDEKYLYAPVSKIEKKLVVGLPVYNFSVDADESYTVEGVAVHNCTAPSFSEGSLHSAVVEIIVKKGATVQYTTVQNWYKNVYNLVTKRAWVEEEGHMIWTDFNMGSRITMKYPSFILAGKGARGETLSMAMAGGGQHQDTGSKAIHLAPYTSSTIMSKSISFRGGRTSYRGMVNIGPNAHHSKSKVVCDALILDPQSRSDTYPTNKILNSDVTLEHEASVSRIGEEQLFYLMSRGVPENEAGKMIVQGFADPLVKKLPLEYAVEMNRLIDMEMQGSVG